MNKTPFASWARIELMGHLSLMGYVEEVEIFGTTMVCVLPIDEDGKEGSKRYFGPSAVSSLAPCEETEIRELVAQRQERAQRRQLMWAPPRQPEIAEEVADGDDHTQAGEDDDEDDGSEDDEGLADRPPNWF